MLILLRKEGQKIMIGDDVIVTIHRVLGERVSVGIEAPKDVAVHREEVYLKLKGEGVNDAIR